MVNVQQGDKVKGTYFGTEFTGVVKSVVCVNNGRNPAYAYHVELDKPVNHYGDVKRSLGWIDRDQLSLDNYLTRTV